MKNKTRMEPMAVLYPQPAVIIGADVDGVPDLTTIAWATVACGTPPWLAIALNGVRHSLKGVRQNMVFTVNIPNSSQYVETDYCGLTTGSRNDKVKDCGWEVFYGDLKGAPYVQECGVNIGCAVEHMLKLGSHYLIAGPVKEMYVSDDCLTDGKIDLGKVDPIVYLSRPTGTYNKVGEFLGTAFREGRKIKDMPEDWDRHMAK